jgi:DNA-binding transcriptional MerR regulator
MSDMEANFGIGVFSRMTFVSVKALRHYDEIGLLAPAWVDPDSGYRHYSAAQVPVAQVIRRLRDLEMPLDQIAVVVQERDVGTRNAAIADHLRHMEDQLEETRATVASLRALLEHGPAPIAVEYRRLPPATAIAIAEEIANAEIPEWLDAALRELRAMVDALGLERAGVDSALYASELLEEEHGEIVALIPVVGTAEITGRGRARIIPATEYAVATHRGSFEDLDQTFGALGAAVAERAIGVQGAIRENYLVGALDTPDERRHRTEVCWPVFQIAPAE